VAELELLDGISQLPADEWNALVGRDSPFLEWEWLASLEESGSVGGNTGWLPRPLVAREGGRLVAAAPLYVKLDSQGEFVFDWSWADAAERAGIRYYPKLLVGVPFTPVAGARVLVCDGADRGVWVRRLGEALRELCDQNQLSSAHVNFCRSDEVEALRAAGFELRIGVQYQWRNEGYRDFADYLARFRSKRRNQIQRELRALGELEVRIETLEGERIPDAIFPAMQRFYHATLDKKVYGRAYLTPAFFELVRERFRSRLCFMVAMHGSEPIAGTFNVQKEGVLYGRYWGCDRELRNLHFNVAYYAAIEHCIRNGLARFEPGAGGEFKRSRGFDAQPTWSLHYIRDPRFERAISHFLERERAEAREALEWYGEHSALKPREVDDST
jgi:uncharacterized protein